MTHAQLDEARPQPHGPAPRRRRLNVDTYYRMAEAGILGPGDRVELIDGEIIDMAPIGSPHAGSVNLLAQAFAETFGRGTVTVSVQHPLRLDAHNEPQPDLQPGGPLAVASAGSAWGCTGGTRAAARAACQAHER